MFIVYHSNPKGGCEHMCAHKQREFDSEDSGQVCGTIWKRERKREREGQKKKGMERKKGRRRGKKKEDRQENGKEEGRGGKRKVRERGRKGRIEKGDVVRGKEREKRGIEDENERMRIYPFLWYDMMSHT